MSENISANVLFHFTSKMEYLKSILRDGFFPHYCPEYTLGPEDRRAVRRKKAPTYAIPMVCFCDLPISLIRKHHKKYGRFAIGLTKTWGMKNGVAPVIYTHSRARTRLTVERLTVDDGQDVRFLAAHSKLYLDYAWRNGRRDKKRVRFYDEREWRYVPNCGDGPPLFLPKEEYQDCARKDAHHKRLQKEHALRIGPDDIQYLIIPYRKDERNILELHKFIMKLYPRKLDGILVTTTIMTDDCLREDA